MIDIMDEGFEIETDFYLPKLKELTEELELKGTISIKLGDKDESQALNKQYREKDYATDVLSFPFNEELPESDGVYVGDIFICHPVAVEQAAENQVSLEQELLTLMVHGVLHLADFDHEEDKGEMLAIQDKFMDKFFS